MGRQRHVHWVSCTVLELSHTSTAHVTSTLPPHHAENRRTYVKFGANLRPHDFNVPQTTQPIPPPKHILPTVKMENDRGEIVDL